MSADAVAVDAVDAIDAADDDGNSLWLSIVCSFAVLAGASLAYTHLEPRGHLELDWRVHAGYWAVALFAVAFVPLGISSYFFTELTVTLVGAMYPIYRATKAVCTPDEDDDKEWLQFWMLGGVLFMLTTWVDDVIKTDKADAVWLGLLLFTFYWLYFPLTRGALLAYERVTEPLLGPHIKHAKSKMDNLITFVYQALANAAHLYFLWLFFMFLPAGLKRVVSILIGTVYPFVSSMTAAATEEIEDDTYWLTYWAVYGCLFLAMDLLETWMGRLPGFYTLVILATVYLMLPMFRGADKVFRKVLVPLAGLQELLILRDSIQIKKQMLRDLPPERADVVRRSIAKFFDGQGADADPTVLKGELMQSWTAIKLPKLFGKSKDEGPPAEDTPLV